MNMTLNSHIDFVTFNIIIDDIVFPDGRTAMGVLGGSGPQTALGMKLWADKVGLVAGVGPDFPPEAKAWLEEIGIDLEGLFYSEELPTLRAWQAMEEDGRRTQVWRVPGSSIGPQLKRSVEILPASYREARGFHFGVHPEEPGSLEFARELRKLGTVVSVETFRVAERTLTDAELRNLVTAAHIFSPNLLEAYSMVGPGEPLDLIHRLADAGAEVIALRQGADGITAHRADTGETWYIPAVEITAVDPVGAGNGFCGGFLAGWVQTGDLRLAGMYGVVAASFIVEQVGLPEPGAHLWEKADARLAELETKVRQIK